MITDTPMMTVLIQHDFPFVVTYQSVINCLIVNNITVSFVYQLYIDILLFATLVTVMLLFGNCIIVCHMFIELYSLYCNDLYCRTALAKVGSNVETWRALLLLFDSQRLSEVYGFNWLDLRSLHWIKLPLRWIFSVQSVGLPNFETKVRNAS